MMIEIRVDGELVDAAKIHETVPHESTWVELTKPTEGEIAQASEHFKVPVTLLKASLDDEELPRVHATDDYIFIILDVPHVEQGLKDTLVFQTYPLAIIIAKSTLLTVTNHDIDFMKAFRDGRSQDVLGQPEAFFDGSETKSALQIVHAIANSFIQALTKIDEISATVEADLHRSMHNKQLIEMLSVDKSLVYLSTSLKSNQTVIKRLETLPEFSSPAEEAELAETHVEIDQALEMAEIYRSILDSTMNVFSSIISNNLNDVMKILTSATIIITIPTLFAGLWGMNVPVPWTRHPYGFFIVLGLAIAASIAFAVWFRKRDYF